MRFVFKASFRSIARSKTRSFLTTLGIIIGVAAVIAMVAIGQGATAAVQDHIARMGTNMLVVMPGSSARGGIREGAGSVATLLNEDADAVRADCPAVAAVAPAVRGAAQCVYGDRNWSTGTMGTTPAYVVVRAWPLESGSMFTDADVRGATKVCVIGRTIVSNLFFGSDPVGQTIRIKKMPFKVIGVLSERGQDPQGHDHDDLVLIPLTTAQKKMLGVTYLHSIYVSAASAGLMTEAQQEITALLRQRHKIPPSQDADFSLRNQTDLAQMAGAASQVMTLLLAAVASVSLVVGGIGIMNIMLVSVSERTREIGIRRAIGARRRDILLQFLTEAVILSILGGVLGVLAGVGSTLLISRIAQWPTLISPGSVLGAFSFSGAIGVFFGFYPARKAARLNPIDALRYE